MEFKWLDCCRDLLKKVPGHAIKYKITQSIKLFMGLSVWESLVKSPGCPMIFNTAKSTLQKSTIKNEILVYKLPYIKDSQN